MFASTMILMRAVNHDWRGYVITGVSALLVLRRSWNPLWPLTGGALAGITGLV